MKRNTKPIPKPRTIDEYLAALSAEKRAALEKLRKDIRSAAPKAEKCISYGVPAFRVNGKFLFAMGGTAKHCAFYLGSTVQPFKDELKKYDTSKWHDPFSSEPSTSDSASAEAGKRSHRREKP